ncbi:MAG: hypothetical protein COV75_06850 [Candidatus Omnitrophica bacterium CG11_big_fil_rev_8_21_14_0_20_63_9]|nr:MAG: hypothetical protein COV75_06850 [Candidatus Omnitrophica bacterium CG11_big_fil_rev_8_21_14_0_20_63_9]
MTNLPGSADLPAGWEPVLQDVWALKDRCVALTGILGLTAQSHRRVEIASTDRYQGGREILLSSGLTVAEIEAIRLTEAERRYYDALYVFRLVLLAVQEHLSRFLVLQRRGELAAAREVIAICRLRIADVIREQFP